MIEAGAPSARTRFSGNLRASTLPLLLICLPLAVFAALMYVMKHQGYRDAVLLIVVLFVLVLGLKSQRFCLYATIVSICLWSLLRRLYPATVPAMDLLAIGPLLIGVPNAVRGLARLSQLRSRALILFLGAALVSGLFLLAAPQVLSAGVISLVVPIGFAVHLNHDPRWRRHASRAFVLGGLFVSTYGLLQFSHLPSWDAVWLEAVKQASFGTPALHNFRPFSSMPSPTTAAFLIGVSLLLIVSQAEDRLPLWFRVIGASLMASFLILTQVRTAWLATALALLMVSFSGETRKRLLLSLLLLIIVGLAAFVALSRPQVQERAQTLNTLGSDNSVQVRVNLALHSGIYAAPLGRGIGSSSGASRARQDSTVDNGYLAVLSETGIPGIVFLVTFMAQLARSSPTRPYVAMMAVSMAAGPSIYGVLGMILWSFAIPPCAPIPKGTGLWQPRGPAALG